MLPQETIDRIKADAENKYPFRWPKNKKGELIEQRVGQNPVGWRKHRNVVDGYIAGATAEATRALEREKVLVEALEEVLRLRDLWQYCNGIPLEHENEVIALKNMEEKVKAALASYIGEKEVGKKCED